MKAYVTTTIVGVLAFDDNGKILAKRFFPKDAKEIAERFGKARANEVIEEEKMVIKELGEKGYKDVVLNKNIESHEISKDTKIIFQEQHKGIEWARNFRKIALESGWVSSDVELNALLVEVNIILSGQKIKSVGRDKIIIHVIGVIDELDDDINSLSERLREWYGLHFPELAREIKGHESYAETISKYGKRENIKNGKLAEYASKSVGMEFDESDEKSIVIFSKSLLSMIKTREHLAKYIEDLCKEVMPNFSALAGPLIASRLLAHAGGLEKLAKMPSSTIQLLGAEKALFRHLKGKGKSPKYGVLFAHPLIQKAPKDLRGKVARLISSKLSLAAKMDFYSKKDRSKELKEELEKSVESLIKNETSK
jgi:nucleolar protein 56